MSIFVSEALAYTKPMNEYGFLLVIAGILLIGAMSPGPSFLVVAKNALGQSRAHGVATALGTGLGVFIFAVLASFGVTTLIETVPNVYIVFKVVGGIYLLFLAWRIWAGATQPLETEQLPGQVNIGWTKSFSIGLMTQTSNPKTALVIAGIFAAFVPAEPPSGTTLMVALIAFVVDFSWYALVAISLSTSRSRRAYRRAKAGFDRTAAVFLAAVAVRLMLTSAAD